MLVKFNPTGTHIHKGFLKVRLDLYPDIGDKTYPLHYVDAVDEEGNPTGNKQLNPCLCHFVVVDKSISAVGLGNLIKTTFDISTVTKLDEALSKSDISQLQRVMKSKRGPGEKLKLPISQTAEEKLVGQLNNRFADMEIEV